jgi:hypothetical protein
MRPSDMKLAVLERDGQCMAPVLDPAGAGPCYDTWGFPLAVRAHVTMTDLEPDYIREGSVGRRHELPIDHVALCPGHHRGTGPSGGRQWATAHRDLLRDYLTKLGRGNDGKG